MEYDIKGPGGGAGVRTEGLSKAYGQTSVLNGLSFELKAGEFTAVVGRSGCGKTTLLRLLGCLEAPDEGSVSVDGEPRSDLNPDTRIMFQEDRLLPWKTVLENVGLGLAGDWRRVAMTALGDVGLGLRQGDWPRTLSGGQRQRVALARALAHSPKLLLLDEPMGALDALTRIGMQALVERVWASRGFTALLVTHDVAEAITLADRVILLENGRISQDLKISLPRPRQRDMDFAKLESEVLNWILSLYAGYI
ncbi:MAG: ATP-binding cassette domain-containing protein [Deltaproteobacteria bacterium]|jgi:sulfonate transport system ATP-binding protein|nr:ATP-binding cassette domain-containing protein [Deltaproteobacteria bacterium]